jgi:hypothetical protein
MGENKRRRFLPSHKKQSESQAAFFSTKTADSIFHSSAPFEFQFQLQNTPAATFLNTAPF